MDLLPREARAIPARPDIPSWRALRLSWTGGLRWLSVSALVLALAVPMFVMRMHPTLSGMARLTLCMVLSGAASLLIAAVAGWFSGLGHTESVHTRFGTLILLSVLVISVNVVLLARLLFSSSHDVDLLLTFLAFGIAVALVVTSPIAGRIARALGRLELGAGRIAAGEYSFRIAEDSPRGTEELMRLARAINEMASGIQRASTRQGIAEAHRLRTITAVSHDLRTPVAAIQAMVDAIADGVVRDETTVRRYHEILRAEVCRLSTMLDDLFELTRLETGADDMNCDRTNIGDIVVDSVDEAQERAEWASVHLTYRVATALPDVSVDCAKIHRVLTSLVDNALRYTPPGGAILVSASARTPSDPHTDVLVEVIDTGEGISTSDLPRVFEPTYRAEPSRLRQAATLTAPTTGREVGLGLTIAAHVVEKHGGRIWAESPLPPAARALVALPGEPLDTPSATPGTAVSFILPTVRG
ncbi:MAG TPA: HAMP domain-containing sensor histidine kinase [Ktedonobacterales bacterium]|jgi:signal transduction histidine kinase